MKLILRLVMLVWWVGTIGGHSVVHTTSGRVEGMDIRTTWGDVTVYFGIPYAEPPLGKNRFMPSQGITIPRRVPGGPSNDSDDAYGYNLMGNIKVNSGGTTLPPACPHFPDSPEQASAFSLQRDEDCLKLSIYVPADVNYNPAVEKLPILVFVPGASFAEAHSGLFDGSAMASLDRIMVITLNYRVGVFGYLSTGNSSLYGNAGISDILSALEWIRANGDSFGGNVSSITVAGTFHGSVALSAAVTSPRFLRKGTKQEPLAQRVIFHGGIGTGRWAMEEDPIQPFLKLAGMSDCLPRNSIEDVISCLQDIPSNALLEKAVRVPEIWRPTVDNLLIHGNPLELIEFGKFPDSVAVMIGENGGSGSLCLMALYQKNSIMLKKIQDDTLNEEDLGHLIADDLNDFLKVNDEGLAAAVTHEYLYPGVPEASLRDTYQHFCGIMFIRNPDELAARYISRFQNDVFRYEFEHYSTHSIYPDWMGASVGVEAIFLFPPNGTQFVDNDLRVFQEFRGSWTNFVKTGNPSITAGAWPGFDEETKKMLVFTSQEMKLDTSRFLDRDVHFWRQTITPLLKSVEAGVMCKNPETLQKLCAIVSAAASATTATNIFLIFLIFLGFCVMICLSVVVYRKWRKNRLRFH